MKGTYFESRRINFVFELIVLFLILIFFSVPGFCEISPPLSIDLQAGSDSGVSSDDNLTNIATPVIDIVAAREGDTINVYREEILLGQAELVEGVLYQYIFADGQLLEGSNIISARSYDGVEESVDSTALEIELDISGPRIIDHMPRGAVNINSVTLDSVIITFNEEIYFDPVDGSFTLDDITIDGPENEIILSDLIALGNDEYEISFPQQTSLGIYTVSVGPEIADLAGNLMDQDQDGEGGEEEEDVGVASFLVDEG